MGLFKKLFGKKKTTEINTGISEPWYNEAGQSHANDSYKSTDPLTGKKKKKLMDPIYNCVPGNAQDANSIQKSGM